MASPHAVACVAIVELSTIFIGLASAYVGFASAAFSIHAAVALGADVSVVAGEAVFTVHNFTCSGVGVARNGPAHGSFLTAAIDDRGWINLTGPLVADPSAVADVSIVKGEAVFTDFAFARLSESGTALSSGAVVELTAISVARGAARAWVSVTALGVVLVVAKLALTCFRIACGCLARRIVAVVTCDR